MTEVDDIQAMAAAIRLAKRGFPAPNPHVGCVLVKRGRIIGRGYHAYAGGPHAEVVALQEAGAEARGATAYVTLEPCNHTGRTGPCSLALIEAGIVRVVAAVGDPNPRAQGGLQRLADAGIQVEQGLLEVAAADACQQFLFSNRHRRPMVVLKAGASLDGRIALPNGASRWITDPVARKEAHRLRAELGAVLVGRATIEMDDPELTARIPGVHNQPLRVVLDPGNRLATSYRVFNDRAPTLHLTAAKLALRQGTFEVQDLLTKIFEAGATGLLVEGGGRTHGHFLRSRTVDRLELFYGPLVLGEGPGWAEGHFADLPSDCPRFKVSRVRKLGSGFHVAASIGVPDGNLSSPEPSEN